MKKADLVQKLEQASLIINACISELQGGEKTLKTKPVVNLFQKDGSIETISNSDLNYSLNIRAFVKRYAKEKGPAEKFVLILAFLAKGRIGAEVGVADVAKEWNKMTSKDLLGTKFNSKYPVVAKNQGWVNSPKRGQFVLLGEWTKVI